MPQGKLLEKEGTKLSYTGHFFKRMILKSFQILRKQTLFNLSLTIAY